MMNDQFHQPAFADEIVSFAEVAESGSVFDCYGGDAGFGEVLLETYPGLKYFYFDLDNTAVITASMRLGRFGDRVSIKKANCRDLDIRIDEEGLDQIDCAIYDPGLRLEYVINPSRGFMVKQSGPLDGRYDQDQGETIADVVNNTTVDHLTGIFKVIEIPFPEKIARAIEEHRKKITITTTSELAKIVSSAIPPKAKRRKVLPEVLVILALRIYVNDEINALAEALQKGFKALRKGGRLLTISYHSAEARVYKAFARKYDERYAEERMKRLRVLTRKAVKPSEDSIRNNPLIRSAQFRAYEKIK